MRGWSKKFVTFQIEIDIQSNFWSKIGFMNIQILDIYVKSRKYNLQELYHSEENIAILFLSVQFCIVNQIKMIHIRFMKVKVQINRL